MNCQTFSTGLSSGHFGGSGTKRDVGRDDEPARQVPSGLVEQERRRASWRDLGCDLGEVQVHRLGVAGGQDERRPLPSLGQIAPKM